jgi:hypothetical protein
MASLDTLKKLESYLSGIVSKIAGALKSEKWVNHEFESSSSKTPEFKQFARDFLSDIKKLCEGYEIVNKNVGHFYVSGFLKKDDKFVYFSVSDVRHFPNEWFNHILIRTAKNEKDYTGGSNTYTKLQNIKNAVDNLMNSSKAANVDMGQYDAIKKDKPKSSPFDTEHHSVSYERKGSDGFVVGYHYPNGQSGKRKEMYRVEMSQKDYEKKLKSIISRHGSSVEGAEQAFKAFKP